MEKLSPVVTYGAPAMWRKKDIDILLKSYEKVRVWPFHCIMCWESLCWELHKFFEWCDGGNDQSCNVLFISALNACHIMKDWDEIDWRRVWKQFIFLQADGLVVMEICWKEKIFWADFLVQGLWGIKGLLETQIIGSQRLTRLYFLMMREDMWNYTGKKQDLLIGLRICRCAHLHTTGNWMLYWFSITELFWAPQN